LHLDAADEAEPLKAAGSWLGKLGLDELSDAQIAVLAEWLPEVQDPELAARLADLLWIRKKPRDHNHGRQAAEAYVRSGLHLSRAEHGWYLAPNRLRRAFKLACKFQNGASVARASKNSSRTGVGQERVRAMRGSSRCYSRLDLRLRCLCTQRWQNPALRRPKTKRADITSARLR
jgi:hypothetical protein